MADDVDIVILTALELEAAPFESLLKDVAQHSAHRRYLAGTAERDAPEGTSVVVWPIGGMGNVRSAIAAHEAITIWNPSYLLLVGISGGVRRPERELGDVLVPEQIVGYEPGKQAAKPQVRFDVFRAGREVLAAAREAAREPWWGNVWTVRPDGSSDRPSVHFGVVASGEKVIADSDWMRDFLDVWPRVQGVEMEGLGVAAAAYESASAPSVGIIKAISDWADSSKADDWQPYAANAAAAFTVEVISRLRPPKGRAQPQLKGSPLSTNAPPQLKAGWGPKKVEFCRGLTEQEARELADCFEIEPYDKDRLSDVAYCSSLWDYLQRRGKLSGLPVLVETCLKRPDLVSLLQEVIPSE